RDRTGTGEGGGLAINEGAFNAGKWRPTRGRAKQGSASLVPWDMEMRGDDGGVGMDQPIARRDFLNGVAIAAGSIASAMLPATAKEVLAGAAETHAARGYYPPSLTGLRGSHPGSFEPAPKLRYGDLARQAARAAGNYGLV